MAKSLFMPPTVRPEAVRDNIEPVSVDRESRSFAQEALEILRSSAWTTGPDPAPRSGHRLVRLPDAWIARSFASRGQGTSERTQCQQRRRMTAARGHRD